MGSGEWGMGSGGQRKYLLDSPLPIPHSPLPTVFWGDRM